MARVYIGEDEYSYSIIEPEKMYDGSLITHCEAPPETILRWLEVIAEYRRVQSEMGDAFKRGVVRKVVLHE